MWYAADRDLRSASWSFPAGAIVLLDRCEMLNETARKWHALAQRRRNHFVELQRSGRWRRMYSEHAFQAGMRDALREVEAWARVIEKSEGASRDAKADTR